MFFSKQINAIIYFSVLLFTATFIVWGNVFISISCYALVLMWLLEGNYSEKIKTLWKAKTPLFFILIFLVILIWSLVQFPNDRAIREVLDNLPLLIFPFVIGTQPRLSHNRFHTILLLYLISITLNTLFCFGFYFKTSAEYADVRTISYFMSYIRLSLFSLVGVLAAIYYLFYNTSLKISIQEKRFLWVALIWLTFFVIFMGSLTGYVAILSLSFVFAFSQILRQKEQAGIAASIALVTISLLVITGVTMREVKSFSSPDKITVAELDSVSMLGNTYKPFEKPSSIENGHWVNLYICNHELDSVWPTLSEYKIRGKDKKGQPLYSTLIRYLTSKNLRKDASGLKQLSLNDIDLIESGCTNYRFNNSFDFTHRIYQVAWEFHQHSIGSNPSGHSVVQRFEFFKCALSVFKSNFVWGTGPADLNMELRKHYKESGTRLAEKYWYRPHNQFLLFAVQYGIVGLTIILISLFGLIYSLRYHMSMLSICWFVITGISFLNEDMLDNLPGLVFFAFFGSLFLFQQPISKKS